MTTSEEKYKDIINKSWPADPAIYRRHPKMPLTDRAKIFAPFAALRGHSDRLGEEAGKLLLTTRMERSEEEAEILSARLSQVKNGMEVTVVYFEPDSPDGENGYYVTLTGKVSEFDPTYQVIHIATGIQGEKGEIIREIPFNDLADVQGDEIIGEAFFDSAC
ncbi:MAG: YolD-like family protein [Clostridiales bacterium]|nr:YolD-like family protein [Clostridiales bacterium]